MKDPRIYVGILGAVILLNVGTVIAGIFTMRPLLAVEGLINLLISGSTAYGGYILGKQRSKIKWPYRKR